ncbi:MAG: DNA polymerase, partial [Patescibacteria group bacterium]
MSKPPEKNFKRYMLVDGNALIHRAFHAIPNLSTKAGEPTNAVYGFSVILLKALKDIKPTHIALTFDLAGPTFRHDKYKEYKATRVKAADELYAQIPRCKEVVADLGIPIYEQSGFEADDMLGTLAEHIKHSNNDHKHFEVIIVTGDLDTLQLVDEHVKVYTLRKGLTDTIIYDPAAVFERYGIKPTQMVDFKAIKGDPSDNIPGVRGIGEKGALDLIKEYGSIEKIYVNLNKLKEKTKKLFEEQKELVELSLWLSQIIKDVKIEFNIPQYEFSQINYGKIVELFQKLEFRTLIPKLPQISGNKEVSVEEAQQIQPKSNDNYKLIDTEEKLKDLTTQLSKQEEFVFDTETEGLGALDFNLVGISFCFKEGHAYYLPAEFLSSSKNKDIQKIFGDEKIKKIGHNIKYDYLALKKYGIEVNNLYFDTMIASYLLAPGSRSHDLDSLAFNEFGYQMQPIEELIGKGKKQISMKDVPKEKVCFYAAEDADYTFRLKQKLLPQLKKEELDKIFFNIEMPLTKVLAEMEENGVLLDIPLFKKLGKEVQSDLQKLETKIYKEAGEEFNINSPAQLKVILFQKLSIPIGGEGMFVKKTKTGYSTAASELEKMKGLHPIIDMILEYRELSKHQTTYVKALTELVSK